MGSTNLKDDGDHLVPRCRSPSANSCISVSPHLTPTSSKLTIFGKPSLSTLEYLGLWRNPLGRKLAGDWGMAGIPWDALEMLMVHEGRCGLQAAVTVQLAIAGGWRGRLLQPNHRRACELLVDGKWVLADADLWEEGFIGTNDAGDLATVDWCVGHIEYISHNWQVRPSTPHGYAYFLSLTD